MFSDELLHHLVKITDTDDPVGYKTAGVAMVSGERSAHHMVGNGLASDALPRMRVASISKMVTALTIHSLAADDRMSMSTRLRDVLGAGHREITVAHLLSHRSGLTDLGGYIIEPPEAAFELLEKAPTQSAHPPGTFFRYCNLGYILLGMMMETITGQRFDQLVREHVLQPAGVEGGFNWVGVSTAKRAHHLPMVQRHGEQYTLEVDGPDADWRADLIWAGGVGRSLANQRIGLDALYFSPHAGLRANVLELAKLAFFLGTSPAGQMAMRQSWAFDGINGMNGGGLFLRFGHGVSLYGDDPRLPHKLVGHAGHALGFSGGAWWNPQKQTASAYTLTGAADETEGEDDEVFYPSKELAILQLLSQAS